MDPPNSLQRLSPTDYSETHSPSSAVSSYSHNPNSVPRPSNSSRLGMSTRIRRRNRTISQCLECRRRKLKCDKSHPCLNCTKVKRECVFLSPALDQAGQLKLMEIKEKLGSLERLLERDVARSAPATANSDRTLPDDADDDLPGAEDEKDLEPTPLAVDDAAYEEDGDDDDDDALDLGIQIGRLRITERLGGFFRPKISQELEYVLTSDHESSERSSFRLPSKMAYYSQNLHEYLKPGPSYIAPTSGFFFGQHVNQASLMDFLPSRLAADRLIKQYFIAVHPIARTVHRPSFEKEYENFWDEISLGREPPNSVQAVVFAAMFSGVISMDEAIILRDFGVTKESFIDNFKLGIETALARAHFLRTTKVETLQAFVMYLIALCRDEVSRAHSVLVGAAIRMAECMGLHRDGEYYGLNPLETHVRRLVWYQLCFLDIRTCESQGPRPSIRKDDFDTKLPLNVNDVDIHLSGKSPSGEDRWTDATFALIRFEANEMIRTIWVDRPRIESRKISLTAVLSKIETFRRQMSTKYDHLIDERIPLQRCAKMVKSILLSRLHIMTLHRYHSSSGRAMPERLCQIILTSGTIMLENSVALEIMPEVELWAWYVGAYHQFHVAFLLLCELFNNTNRKEADRIWPCLDYVFKTDISNTRDVKARKILWELQEKTAAYQERRKMRAPATMDKYIGQKSLKKFDENSGSSFNSQKESATEFNATSTGRVSVPNVVYAGMSNGEALWALPNQASSEASSDGSSMVGQMPIQSPGTELGDDLIADIDWDIVDQLFPPDQLIGEMIPPVYNMFNLGTH